MKQCVHDTFLVNGMECVQLEKTAQNGFFDENAVHKSNGDPFTHIEQSVDFNS